jgi:thioredoxin-related protein
VISVRRILLVAAASALVAGQVFAGPWLTSVDAAQKKAKATKQLIFVDLWADWCGWCHKFEKEVVPTEAFQKATDDMILLRLNTEDGKEGTKLAREYGIRNLPTFIVLNEDLLIAGQIRGYAPANEFAKLIGQTREGYKDFLKRAGSEASFAKDYPKRLQLAREYRERMGLSQSETRFSKLLGEAGLPAGVRDDAYYDLAYTQFVGKKYDKALETLKKFSSVQTKGDAYERSRLLVGDIYLTQGNLLAAANEYRLFKKSFPNSPYVKNIDIVLPQVERQLNAAPPTAKK